MIRFLNKNIACAFSKSRRDYILSKVADGPGPGSYDSYANNRSKSKTKNGFGTTAKREGMVGSKQAAVPGPGNYEAISSVGRSTNGCTLKSRYQDYEFKRKMQIPGPGNYSLSYDAHKKSSTLKYGAKSTTNKSHSQLDNPYSPGPGQYEPSDSGIKKSPSRWKIGNAGRNVLNLIKHETPGPGTYDLSDQAHHGAKFSRSLRKDIADNSRTPGPGAYKNNDFVMKQNPSFSMRPNNKNLQKSIDKYQEGIPGPGMYSDTFHRKANSVGFAKSLRTGFVSKDNTSYPGPGAYKLPSRVAEVPSYENNIKPDEFKYT